MPKIGEYPEADHLNDEDVFLTSDVSQPAGMRYRQTPWLLIKNTMASFVNAVLSVNGYTGHVTLDQSDVGLSEVDNTSDADKPVSAAQQAAIDAVDADLDTHVADVANPHAVTKAQVGLSNADNTSDANKPVSTATQTALDAIDSDLDTHVADTANPHSVTKAQVGLGNVDDTSDATKNAAVATLTNKTLTSPVVNTPTGIVKGDVGLGNVDNTSDATKNAASVTLTNKTLTSPVINSPTGIVKGDVGLGNVDNTSDANKPVSTAQATAIGLKADAASPIFTGTVENQGAEVYSGDITPTILAGNADDYNPTGLATASRIRLSASTTVDVTGIVAGADGRRLVIHNVGASTITLKDEVTSTATNRFGLNGDIALSQDQSLQIEYDGTTQRWRAIGGIGGGGGSVSDGSLTVVKFDASAVVTEAEGLASSDNDTSLPTTAAVRDYVDGRTVLSAVQNASGTAVNFTSIPAGTKEIAVTGVGISTNGSSTPIVQLGDSGGYETTGYVGGVAGLTSTNIVVSASSTSGFLITNSVAASSFVTFTITLRLHNASTNTWLCELAGVRDDLPAVVTTGASSKSLSATLDRLRITATNGSDTFDAGSFSIIYKG